MDSGIYKLIHDITIYPAKPTTNTSSADSLHVATNEAQTSFVSMTKKKEAMNANVMNGWM